MASPSFSPAHSRSVRPRLGGLPGNLLTRALGAVLEWNDRYRQRIHLAQLDDRMLRDMGVSRSEAFHESDKPFWRG